MLSFRSLCSLRSLPLSSFLCHFSSSVPSSALKETPLYEEHLKLQGKMVDFAGYALPVRYKDTMTESHTHTRTNASVFDVSHMLQLIIEGKDRIPFIERVTVGDFQGGPKQKATYTLITNKQGGIVDDCMVTSYHDHLYMVVNAGCAEKDWEHLHSLTEGYDVQIKKLDNALIALQGPLSAQVLKGLVTVNLKSMEFLHSNRITVGGEHSCIVTRCGYTGEDGFEISVPKAAAPAIWNSFLDFDREKVWPAGLGTRDSLRLESGLCLYGNDIDDTTTPGEASLLWTISKRRRQEGGFVGDDVILDQIRTKQYKKKRVGVMLKVKGIPREGAEILSTDGTEVIGTLTSGSISPVLKQAIGMAYVKPAFSKIGTNLHVRVKNKTFLAEVEKLPFLPTNYYSFKK